MLFVWGIIAFKNLPVEAYPDVANTWVQVITQWPGRAAEEVEQQVTIPIEIQMNGIPHLQHVRSASLAGLSVVNLIFDDDSDNDWDRQKVLERLSQVTLPPNVSAQIGPDFSPIGSVYWYTLKSTNPAYDLMELKSLQDWVISKYIKSVPDVVDDSSFGGITREYQVRVDPDKLISYGLEPGAGGAATGQQQRQRRRQLHRARLAADQCARRGPGHERRRHRKNRPQDAERHGAAGQRHRAWSRKGRRFVWARSARRSIARDGVVVDDNDVVEGIVFLRKGADTRHHGWNLTPWCKRLNDHILPPGVKIVPYLDRDDLVHYTTHTVLHNLAEGMILVVIILFIFLGNVRGAIIVSLTIPFALLFASICLDLRHISANLLSLGRAGFRHGGGWRGGDGRKHRAPSEPAGRRAPRTIAGAHPRGRARSAAAGFLRHRHHHHRVSSDLHSATRGRKTVQADGLDGRVRAAGRVDLLHAGRAGAGQPAVPQRTPNSGRTR